MKKRLSTFILIAVFLVGLGLMMYPTVSNLINNAHQSVAIDSYEKQIASMSKDDFNNILSEAREYNLTITTNEFPRDERDLEGNDDYHKAVNPSGNGMIGYLKIDAIKLKMPIYHTTKESVLQKGVGHIPTTSLPVGGVNTHAVLTGHRGLPSAKLFTDLDKLVVGDVFYIYVLDDILAYQVDQIKTVDPNDTSDLQIEQGHDYVTLVTCTPYGINTHRLLIRGTRVPYDSTINANRRPSQSIRMFSPIALALIIAGGIMIVSIIILLILKLFEKRRGKY